MDSEIGRFISEDTNPGDPNDPRSLNYYTYCYNNPVRYNDPDGHVPIETIVDVGMLVWDVGRGIAGDKSAWGDVALDVTGMAIPYVPSAALKAAKYGAKALDKTVDATKTVKNITKTVDKTTDASKVVEKTVDTSKSVKTTKTATSGNYRDIYLEANPNMPKDYQVHHTLPQKYESILKDAGVNVHDLENLKGIDPKIHSKVTTEWQKWEKSLDHKPSAKEVQDFAKTIDKKYEKYWHKEK